MPDSVQFTFVLFVCLSVLSNAFLPLCFSRNHLSRVGFVVALSSIRISFFITLLLLFCSGTLPKHMKYIKRGTSGEEQDIKDDVIKLFGLEWRRDFYSVWTIPLLSLRLLLLVSVWITSVQAALITSHSMEEENLHTFVVESSINDLRFICLKVLALDYSNEIVWLSSYFRLAGDSSKEERELIYGNSELHRVCAWWL